MFLILTLATMLIWSSLGLFSKLSTIYISAHLSFFYWVVGVMILSGARFLFVFVQTDTLPAFHPAGSIFGILAGFASAAGMIAFMLALSRGGTSVVVSITALYPIATLLLAKLFLNEPITVTRGLGVVFAVIAVILISR